MELQDPTTSLDSPSTENSSFDSQIAAQSVTASIVSPSDDDSSIVTVRDNGEPLELVDVGDDNDIDSGDDSDDVGGPVALSNQDDQIDAIETVVEVVSPLIAGDGTANQIAIVRANDLPSLGDCGDFTDSLLAQIIDDDTDEFELSLNDKMKNVLQELVENERVKLSFSKSITEDDDDDLGDDATDNAGKSDNNNDDSEWTTTDEVSLTEDNGNVKVIQTADTKSIDDIIQNDNEENANASLTTDATTTTTTSITVTKTIELNIDDVSPDAGDIIDSPISDEHVDADIDVEQDDDDSVQEASAISVDTIATDATATSESSSSKGANSSNINNNNNNANNKKKKRKSKGKKK